MKIKIEIDFDESGDDGDTIKQCIMKALYEQVKYALKRTPEFKERIDSVTKNIVEIGLGVKNETTR
jgi:hypothetical protein